MTNHAVHLEEGELTIAVHIQAFKEGMQVMLVRWAARRLQGCSKLLLVDAVGRVRVPLTEHVDRARATSNEALLQLLYEHIARVRLRLWPHDGHRRHVREGRAIAQVRPRRSPVVLERLQCGRRVRHGTWRHIATSEGAQQLMRSHGSGGMPDEGLVLRLDDGTTKLRLRAVGIGGGIVDAAVEVEVRRSRGERTAVLGVIAC